MPGDVFDQVQPRNGRFSDFYFLNKVRVFQILAQCAALTRPEKIVPVKMVPDNLSPRKLVPRIWVILCLLGSLGNCRFGFGF